MARPRLRTLQPRIGQLQPTLREISANSWRSGKNGATARGYTYQWELARRDYLRLHPLCMWCQAEDRVTLATVVDHRDPHCGDMVKFWDKENWQSLCAHHYSSHKQKDENKERNV